MSVVTPRRRPGIATPGVLLAGLFTLGLSFLPVLLLVVAETGRGRVFATVALSVTTGPLLLFLAWRKSRTWGRSALAGLALWIVGATGGLDVTAPTGTSSASARVANSFQSGSPGFRHHALGNLLPENDQLRLGFTLMPLVDPLFTTSQASLLKHWTSEVYAELENDAGFRSLGSALPQAYSELRGSLGKPSHAFVYVPASIDRTKPAPLLVFFHGSGGNLKGYLWVLSTVADRTGCVVIAPTFGLGNWRPRETNEALHLALEAAAQSGVIDRKAIHIAGLSNGGLAVSQALANTDLPLRSCIFISPVFDEAELGRLSQSANAGLPVFVVTGALDDRVPPDYVRRNADKLRQVGAKVKLEAVADADHFLMFSHRRLLVDQLIAWLESNRAAR